MAGTLNDPSAAPVGVETMQRLMALIARTRSEIEDLRGAFGEDGMLSAFSDLDGIVAATEESSLVILEAAEKIQRAGQRGGSREVQERALAIMTACCFQDLTSQRISRLKRVLQQAAYHIAMLGQTWEVAGFGVPQAPAKDTRSDAHLLHGPAAHVSRA